MASIILQILELIVPFLSGILLCYILFPKTDLIKRIVYSITLTIPISYLLGIFLRIINRLNKQNMLIFLTSLNLFFALILILKFKNRKYKTKFNKDIFYILIFSLLGSFWKFWFLKSIKNPSDAYGYAFNFIGKEIPNLGFYTGMAVDKSKYFGLKAISVLFGNLTITLKF